MTDTTANRRYILSDVLGQGGMGIVYRSRDRLTGQSVALKQIKLVADAVRDTPGSDFHVALSNEFRVLASLRHPNIIKVLDFGIDGGQPYFTMELLESPQTILSAAQMVPVADRVRLLIELLQALMYLHRRGILHRDLKPGNVLVDNAGTVNILDFGLSLMTITSLSNVQQNTVGTLAYMAPELFADEPATVSSDLYAVGVIACEILTGHHPFNQKNVSTLVSSVLNALPNLTGADPSLVPILRRLLEKDPTRRYAEAEDVIYALCEASDQPLPVETNAIRESFLQAARFVGRDDELNTLRAALKQIAAERPPTGADAVNSAWGSAWLIGGESGSGKSRLFEEIQIRVMVYGALVVRGQAITAGSIPYQLWREPLRRLALAVDLSDEEAGVLKTIVPDIDVLLERVISDPAVLDPQSNQTRLLKVVSDLFRRAGQPVVVILEDLQWAAEENLLLFKRLNTLVDDLPLLLLGNFRNDESPHLPETLTGARIITLYRFDDASIAELTAAILGKAGQQADTIRFLQHETEGNVFFLIETLRALAEQAGQLDRITPGNLVVGLMPKGIQDIVQRRLNRVPLTIRPLLQMAALAGRDLDLKVCATFSPPDQNTILSLDHWLTTCADAAVLEVQEQHWRFSHDRLRETLLAEIPAASLPSMHRQLGETLERLYPDSPEHIPAMAFHFQQAADHGKAIPYLTRAGEIAAAAFANDRAVGFYRSALDEYAQLDAAEQQKASWQILYVDVNERLGDLLEVTGKHEPAREAFQIAIGQVASDDILWRARLLRKTGNTWQNQRSYGEALVSYASTIALLETVPKEPFFDWWSEWLQGQNSRLTIYYWTGKTSEMKTLGEQIGPNFEAHGTPMQRRLFLANMSLMGLRRDRFTVSDETLAYGLAILAVPGEWGDTADDHFNRFGAGFIHLWRGNLDEAEKLLLDAKQGIERTGEVTTLSRALNYLAVIYRKRVQIEQVRDYAHRTMKVALAGNMLEYISSANGHLAWALLREGHTAEALTLAADAYQMMRVGAVAIGGVIVWVTCWPLIGAEVALGQVAEAIEHVKVLIGPTQQPQPESVQAALEAAIRAWEQNDLELTNQHLSNAINLARAWGYV